MDDAMAGCPSCKADVPAGDRFCGACGYDTHREVHIAAVLEPKLRLARGWILAVGIIYVVSAVLQIALAGDRLVSGGATLLLALNGALFVIHLGLWWWARTAPLAAAIVALCLFVTLQLVEATLDPTSLARGVIIKVLFLVALVQAVRAGVEAQRIRRGHA